MNETQTSINQILDHEPVVNNLTHYHKTWEAGDVAHQGDIIFVGLKLPKNHKLTKVRKNRQLAEGDSQGSRHVLEGGQIFDVDLTELVKLIKNQVGLDIQEKYIGPVFKTPAEVTHPEHGNHVWEDKCFIAVVYQRSLDIEEIEQRVRD